MSPITVEQFLSAKPGDLIIDASGEFTRISLWSGKQIPTVFVENPNIRKLCIVDGKIVDGKYIANEDFNHPDALLISVSNDKLHPECGEGEMLLTIVSADKAYLYRLHFESYRIGSIAYDSKGVSMPGFVPIFILKEEYDQILE